MPANPPASGLPAQGILIACSPAGSLSSALAPLDDDASMVVLKVLDEVRLFPSCPLMRKPESQGRNGVGMEGRFPQAEAG